MGPKATSGIREVRRMTIEIGTAGAGQRGQCPSRPDHMRRTAATAVRLPVRGVKAILTRAGVDHSELEIYQGTSVVIKGPREARRQASHVLYERGLSNAPYPDLDMWSRP